MNSVPNDLQTWKRFVKDGVLDEARLRKRIAESWHRCKKAEVNPYLEKGPKVLQQTELDQQSKKHSFFLTTAKPYLEKLLPAIKEMEMMALLIDSDGVVLALTTIPARSMKPNASTLLKGHAGRKRLSEQMRLARRSTSASRLRYKDQSITPLLPIFGTVQLLRFTMRMAALRV